MPAKTVVQMATVGGAKAIGMSHCIGSLEPGKKADIIGLDLSSPHAVPLYDVFSLLVYAIKSSDVQFVMVNGRVIVEAGKLTSLDVGKAIDEAQQLAGSIGRDREAHINASN